MLDQSLLVSANEISSILENDQKYAQSTLEEANKMKMKVLEDKKVL